MIQPAPIAISDRYTAIAEQSPLRSIDVSLNNLTVAKPRKMKPNRAKLRKKFNDVHDAGSECCPTTATTSLHLKWAKRKSILNYGKIMNSEYNANLDWATNIDTVVATSFGIEGWALCDVEPLDGPGTSSTSSSTDVREGRGVAGREGRGAVPLSIRSPGSSTNTIARYPLACVDPPRSQASGS